MGSPRAISDDHARSAFGRSAAVLQHLMGWGTEALDGLDHHSAQLADLARALLRNHATGPQVQRLITMIDSGTLGGGLDDGPVAARQEVVRLMFESVAGRAYSDNAWKDATYSGGLPFDNALDPIRIGRRLRRMGMQNGWDQGLAILPESELGSVAVAKVEKRPYEQHGYPGGYEAALDSVAGQRTSFSLGAAILMLAPGMIGRSETWIFSSTVISSDPASDGPGYEWFPGIARNCDQQLLIVKCRMDRARTPSDGFWYSVRIARP